MILQYIRERDLDNLMKALSDTLTRNHSVTDDSMIVDLGVAWARSYVPGAVYVEVEAV